VRKLNSGEWIFEMYQSINSAVFTEKDAEYSQVKYTENGVAKKVLFETPEKTGTVAEYLSSKYTWFYIKKDSIKYVCEDTNNVVFSNLKNPKPKTIIKNPSEIINSIVNSNNMKLALDSYGSIDINRDDISKICCELNTEGSKIISLFILQEWLNAKIDNSNCFELWINSIIKSPEYIIEYMTIVRKLCLGEYSQDKVLRATNIVKTFTEVAHTNEHKAVIVLEFRAIIKTLQSATTKDMTAIADLMPAFLPYLI
jgi:hypothetical protein